MTGNVQFSCQSRRLNLSRPPVAEARATRAFGGFFFVKGPCSGPPKKIAAIETGSMPRKRVPVKYPCTLGDHTDDDDMEEEVEDPTLSGGLRRNFDGEEDRFRRMMTMRKVTRSSAGKGNRNRKMKMMKIHLAPTLQKRKTWQGRRTAVKVALRLLVPPIARAQNFLKDLLWHPGNARNG